MSSDAKQYQKGIKILLIDWIFKLCVWAAWPMLLIKPRWSRMHYDLFATKYYWMTFMPMIFRLSKHILHLFVVLNVQGLTDNSIEMSLAIERPTETISYLKLFVHRIRRHSESRFEGLLISKYIEEKPFSTLPFG